MKFGRPPGPAFSWRRQSCSEGQLTVCHDKPATRSEPAENPETQKLYHKDRHTEIPRYLRQNMSPPFSRVGCTCPMMRLSLGGSDTEGVRFRESEDCGASIALQGKYELSTTLNVHNQPGLGCGHHLFHTAIGPSSQ